MASVGAVMNAETCSWIWSPDARLIRLREGALAINYATSNTLVLTPDDAEHAASVSGLATEFHLPNALSDVAKASLIRGQFIIPSDRFDAIQSLVRERLATALQESYGFIIMPTERCNFRCTYCYEAFERGRMSDENVAALDAAIDRVAVTASQFALGFFGGEPLACSDLVLHFSQRAFEAMASRGLPYAASIATNGSLLSAELFEQLLDVGVVSYQITIDGDRATHDRQRVSLGGRGTFDRIVRNVRSMASTDADFVCVIRCNLPADQRARALDLFTGSELAFVVDDSRFVVDVQTVWASDRQTVGSYGVGCGVSMQQALDYYVLNRQLSEHGVRTVTYDQASGILSQACYAGKRNWFIVGPDLTLYKCTVVFDNERNRVGRIAPGGMIEVDAEKNRLWTGSNALTDAGCSGCHLRVPCGGIACPLSRITNGIKGCLDVRDTGTLRRWAAARPHPAPSAPVGEDAVEVSA
ncbi:MAG: radical SAM protein [Actinomycetota bacterium]|nr:radical SAM protein [Actinomycetota bacterium]